MTEPTHHGGWTFVVPEGFHLVDAGAEPGAATTQGVHLEHVPSDPSVPDYSESSEDLRLSMYPVSIVLTPLFGQGGAPLSYLRNAEQVLARHFDGFAIDFSEAAPFDGRPQAARSQARFSTNFALYRLSYAWLVEPGLVVCTLTVTEPGVKEGWRRLCELVQTVNLETPEHT